MVNRQDYDCSICPVEDPSTWTADDLDFKIICEDGGGELSYQLDNFLEVNWLQSTTIELVYNSEDNGEFRELVTKTAGTQKKTIPNLIRGCLRFKVENILQQEICQSCGEFVCMSKDIHHGCNHFFPLTISGQEHLKRIQRTQLFS